MHPLPEQVQVICETTAAPPRLVAHLTLVHDAVVSLVEEIRRCLPALSFDEESVFFGAATHDIGKSLYRNELTGAGSEHEITGERLLLDLGIDTNLARFARTHAAWGADTDLTIEDLLVSLADNCWKGKRISQLETLIAERIAAKTDKEIWEIFILLDNVLEHLTAGADERLGWQMQFEA